MYFGVIEMDYTVYTNEYLKGRKPVIQFEESGFYFDMAESFVREYTRQIDYNIPEMRMCICEVAELVHQSESADSAGIAAESTGDVSITYADTEKQINSCREKIRSAVYRRLAHTGLLYRGLAR